MPVVDEDLDIPAKSEMVKVRWLPQLEQELKCRIGWTDEAISPFGRKKPTSPAIVEIDRAAA